MKILCLFPKGWVVVMLEKRKINRGMSTIESMIAMIVVVVFVIWGIVSLFTSEKPTCIRYGCDREQDKDSDYCYLHKSSSYSGTSSGKTTGSKTGSSTSNYSSTVSTSSSTSDTCHHGSCEKKVISGSQYCSSHTCGKGRNGCYREVSSANEKCSSCKAKESSTSSSNTRTSQNSSSYSKKSSSSSKNYEMPDCDDYENYDEFMDDWDGNMPDGSDAEDYWEDW